MARRSAPRWKQVRGKRMAQRVWTDAGLQCVNPDDIAAQQPIHASASQPAAAIVDEHRIAAVRRVCRRRGVVGCRAAAGRPVRGDAMAAGGFRVASNDRPILQPRAQRLRARLVERHDPLLAALAHHAHQAPAADRRSRDPATRARSAAGPRRRTARGSRGRDGRAAPADRASRAAASCPARSGAPAASGRAVARPWRPRDRDRARLRGADTDEAAQRRDLAGHRARASPRRPSSATCDRIVSASRSAAVSSPTRRRPLGGDPGQVLQNVGLVGAHGVRRRVAVAARDDRERRAGALSSGVDGRDTGRVNRLSVVQSG